jgi:hypothetical protein
MRPVTGPVAAPASALVWGSPWAEPWMQTRDLYGALEADAQLAARRNGAALFYVPDSLDGSYQDVAGTALPALNAPIGLLLDRSYGTATLGPELCASAQSAAGWAVFHGSLTSAGGALTLTNAGAAEALVFVSTPVTQGKTYLVTLTVEAASNNGAFTLPNQRRDLGSGAGVKSFQITANASGSSNSIGIGTNAGTAGHSITFRNVSVREVIQPAMALGPERVSFDYWSLASGITQVGKSLIFTNVPAAFSATITAGGEMFAGKTYQVQYTISNYTSGSIYAQSVAGGYTGLTRIGNGTFSEFIRPTNTTTPVFKAASEGSSFTVSGISVREVLADAGLYGPPILQSGVQLNGNTQAGDSFTATAATSINIRHYVGLGDLVDGALYECSVRVTAVTGSPNLGADWCDQGLVSFGTPVVGRTYRLVASRATYDGTFRFFDVAAYGTGSVTYDSVTIRRVNARAARQWDAPSLPLLTRVPRKLGAELVTNGDFSLGLSGWTVGGGATLAVVAGGLQITNTGTNGWATNPTPISVKVGATYRYRVRNTGTSSATFYVRDSNSVASDMVGVTVLPGRGASGVFQAAVPTLNLRVFCMGPAGTVGSVDDISIREVLESSYAMQFDGVDDWLYADQINTGNQGTFIVSDVLASTGWRNMVGSGGQATNTPGVCLGYVSDTASPPGGLRSMRSSASLASGAQHSAAYPDHTPRVLSSVWNSPGAITVRVFSGGTQVASSAVEHPSTSTGGTAIGRITPLAFDWYHGPMALVCIAPVALPDADRRAIERFGAYLVGAAYA